MIQFSAPVATGDAIFDTVPPHLRAFLATGYTALATLPQETRDRMAAEVNRWLDPTNPVPKDADFARDLKIEVDTAHSIRTAVTFQAVALFAESSAMSVEAFIDKAVSADAMRQEDADAVRAFGEQLNADSQLIRDALARERSSAHILPSFRSLDATIDLRVTTEDGQRPVVLPMAIAALRTDVENRDVVFQMTPRDVEWLMRRLARIQEQMASAESVVTQPASRNS